MKGSLNLDLDSLQVTNEDSSKKPDSPRTLMIKANLEKVSPSSQHIICAHQALVTMLASLMAAALSQVAICPSLNVGNSQFSSCSANQASKCNVPLGG